MKTFQQDQKVKILVPVGNGEPMTGTISDITKIDGNILVYTVQVDGINKEVVRLFSEMEPIE